MEILWFIPGHGDSRFLGTQTSRRLTSLAYLSQVARAVDSLGYTGALLPTGQGCEDAWTVASSLIPLTSRMKFLVAMRPGSLSPTLAARTAATFDRLSEGRLLINVITGGDPVELAGDGTFESHDERYAITDEFLTVWRALMMGEEVTFSGKYINIRGGKLLMPPHQQPYPPLYFGGSSPAGLAVAAKHIDLYLTLGEPPGAVAAKIAEVRRLAAEQGRTMRFGVRLHVIVRDTEAEAWEAANELLKYVDEAVITAHMEKLARFDSVGQSRMAALHKGTLSREVLEVSPNLWAGIGLVNKGIGTALVGDPKTVAIRLQEYAALGVDTFILSSYPHLEEAYRVAELVFPHLPEWLEAQQKADSFSSVRSSQPPGNDHFPMRVVMLVQKVDEADWLLGFTVSWIRALAGRVERLDVIALEQCSAALPANVYVHSLGKERGASRVQELIAFQRALRNVIGQADVIFGHLTPRFTWLAAPLAALHGIPQCMWYTHRHVGPELRLALRCSRWVATAATNSFPLPSPKVHVLGHGIDANRFTPDSSSPANDPPLVLAVGRLAPVKHHHILLELAARLRDQGIDAQFAIAGGIASADGAAYKASLDARIAELEIGDRFNLLGAIPGDALLDWYRKSAVVTNLSPPGLFDKAALEAMLTARPVLVANPAFDDLLGDYVDVLRVPTPDDIDAVTRRLAELLSFPAERRAAIGAQLRERTAAAHSLDRLIDRLVTLFES